MNIPIRGVVQRRLLINYRVDPSVMARLLPAPFRPVLINGYAVAGICLIRLGAMRPQGLPARFGLRSENSAHRVAVEWDTPTGVAEGVFIPRRDSNSLLNVAVGGRLFPGVHHAAHFNVSETEQEIRVAFTSRDTTTAVQAVVCVSDTLSGSQLFPDLVAASAFFQRGCLGYSATHDHGRFDGLALKADFWHVDAGTVSEVRSTYFSDHSRFPEGSTQLDNALIMRHIPVTWNPIEPLRLDPPTRIPEDFADVPGC